MFELMQTVKTGLNKLCFDLKRYAVAILSYSNKCYLRRIKQKSLGCKSISNTLCTFRPLLFILNQHGYDSNVSNDVIIMKNTFHE